MLLSIILWPFTVISSVVSFLFNCTVFLVLLPFKVIQSILRSLSCKIQNFYVWTENKIRYVKTLKLFLLLFPIHQLEDTVSDNDSEPSPHVSPTVSRSHHRRGRRNLPSARNTSKRQSPARVRHHQSKSDNDSSTDLTPSSSMNTLIQDLLEFSKQHSSTVPPSDIPEQTKSTAAADGGEEDESEKVLKLIRDLQEIATTQTKTTSSPVKRPDSSTMATTANEEERELDQMLSDLGVFQAYVTKLLDEQERGGATLGTTGEMSMIDIGSLETITEEEMSKECSPFYGSSPSPQCSPPQTLPRYHGNSDHNNKPQSINDDEPLPEVSSEELQLLLKQISDTVRQAEEDNVFDEDKSPSSRETTSGQFTETEKEFQSVIDSLETQHKFIETQHELQEMMNSLDPNTVITSSSLSSRGSSSSTTESPSVPSIDQQQQQVYDNLNPHEAVPVYSLPKKHRKEVNKPPSDTTVTDPVTPTVDEGEQIYDSLLSFTTTETSVVDTPPPLPLKRTQSDGGMSTSSNEHSPKNERRHSRHSSSDDGESHHHHHHHSSHHHSHHRSKRHSRRHSSSSKSSCHCCYHDDESPDGCGHHHRPRSRERHHHHRRHRSRSDSDESQYTRRRRIPRESSGYESQEFESSPSFHRKVSRSYSDATSTTSTPREARRGFLSGLFSRKSTTSLNSISSKMSETGEDISVSSYRI